MSAEKLSSDEVPQKFIEWLLAMGYPEERVPSLDKIAQKCRGQYYMVWRSLIERVRPKNEIRDKRLNVFCDDIRLCQKNNVFNERDSNVVIPEELLVWRQQEGIHKRAVNAESQVSQARQDLRLLMDKVSSRICQRDISRKQVEDKQRRVWLLRQVAAELAQRKASLEETRHIAAALCAVSGDDDLQNKVDKCLALLRKSSLPLLSQPAASSSVMSSTGDDIEEQLCALVRCRGDALWAALCERRAALHAALARANVAHDAGRTRNGHRSETQAALARSASLHCSLALDVMKNRARVRQTRSRFVAYVEDLNDFISGDACELLVLRCERASADARVRSLRTLLDELTSSSGVFANAREHEAPARCGQINTVDKAIESSRDELKRLLVSLAATDRKIHATKEALTAVFNAFHSDTTIDRYKGVQLNFPQEPLSAICQFYERERERRRSKADLSMEFDTSDSSLNNTIDLSNPRFVDELRFYLKKFDLEKNRKLIMESGEKIWIFETIQASLERLRTDWLASNVIPLLCPSASLSGNLRRIVTDRQTKETLQNFIKALGCNRKLTFNLDIAEKKAEEEASIDMKKKKIGENLLSLQKSGKLLELCQKNLQLWKDNVIKEYISPDRTVNGKSYREYEAIYIENLSLTASSTT